LDCVSFYDLIGQFILQKYLVFNPFYITWRSEMGEGITDLPYLINKLMFAFTDVSLNAASSRSFTIPARSKSILPMAKNKLASVCSTKDNPNNIAAKNCP
jgi:hypothetical protein